MKSIETGVKNYVLILEGSLYSYLGDSISKHSDGKGFTMSWPLLIDIIIKAIGFDMAATKDTRDNVPTSY